MGACVEVAERLYEAKLIEHACRPRPFLGQKAGILLIAAPVFEIDGLVRNVPVATEDDFAARVAKTQQVWKKLGQKSEFGDLSFRRAGARRQIHTDDAQVPEVSLDVAPFGIELDAAETDLHRRRTFGVQCDAAVAAFSRGMKRRMRLARRGERPGHIVDMRLDLLQTHDVPGFDTRKPARETLALRGGDAVDVDRNNTNRQAKTHGVETVTRAGPH